MNAIIMELDILHRAVAPEIVDFYGAFTIESNVYYCMEYMDAGSLDVLYLAGVPEDVLARITRSMVKGLGFLKDELQVMHRGELGSGTVDGCIEKITDGENVGCCRCQTYKCVGQQGRTSQAGGFRRIWTVGKESGKDQYRLSKLHGREYNASILRCLAH